MADKNFYPKLSHEDRKSAAFGVCYKNYNAKHKRG